MSRLCSTTCCRLAVASLEGAVVGRCLCQLRGSMERLYRCARHRQGEAQGVVGSGGLGRGDGPARCATCVARASWPRPCGFLRRSRLRAIRPQSGCSRPSSGTAPWQRRRHRRQSSSLYARAVRLRSGNGVRPDSGKRQRVSSGSFSWSSIGGSFGSGRSPE